MVGGREPATSAVWSASKEESLKVLTPSPQATRLLGSVRSDVRKP